MDEPTLEQLAADVATLKAQLAALLTKLDADADNSQLNFIDYAQTVGEVTA